MAVDVVDHVVSEPLLKAAALVKRYGDRAGLGPVDLTVAPAERLVLVGANGSGKTTFMKLAAGLLDPTSGHLTVAGGEAGSIRARAALSYIADSPVFYDDLSLLEHLEYVAGLHGVRSWEPPARALAERLGVADRLDQIPNTYSRGLKQKASVCLGLLRPASIVLVDEPYVGLDLPGREALDALLAERHSAGTAVVVATHQLDQVDAAARCVVLRDGRIVHDGPATSSEVHKLIEHETE